MPETSNPGGGRSTARRDRSNPPRTASADSDTSARQPGYGYAAGLRRRREASYRLPVLHSGRADPWHYPEPPLSALWLAGAEDAAVHLLGAGLPPLLSLDTIRALWHRRDRELACELARLAGVA